MSDAISTYGVTLKWGTTAELLTEKIEIKNFPDVGGTPEMLEKTTLKDAAHTYVLGIQSQDVMEFTANYNKTDYETANTDANKSLYYALEFGNAGDEGIFEWQGEHSVRVVGAGVNAVTEMIISIAPSTQPVLKSE